MFWKITLFYLFLTLTLLFFFYTEEGNENFKLLSRATTPSDQKITTVLPTILACGYGVRGRSRACFCACVNACESARHCSSFAGHVTLLLSSSTQASPSIALDTRRSSPLPQRPPLLQVHSRYRNAPLLSWSSTRIARSLVQDTPLMSPFILCRGAYLEGQELVKVPCSGTCKGSVLAQHRSLAQHCSSCRIGCRTRAPRDQG